MALSSRQFVVWDGLELYNILMLILSEKTE